MTLYQILRRPKWLYKLIYNASCCNHEKKILLQKITVFLKQTDKFILIIPAAFMIERWLSQLTLNVNLQVPTTSLSDRFLKDLSLGFTQLVGIPILRSLYTFFVHDGFIYWFISIFFFYASRVLCGSFEVYRNEALVAECFHATSHYYRDFVDSIVKIKRDNRIFKPTLLNGHSKELGIEYNIQIRELCRRAQHSMAQIINDDRCYISIKWLEDDGNGNYLLKHDRTYPEYIPSSHLTAIELANGIIPNPTNLFQKIINKFKDINQERIQTWQIGEISNDVKGNENFDGSLIKNDFSKVKSTIIMPITVEASLKGFFCFNSSKIGRLREKHRHFLGGYCDLIANIFRSVASNLDTPDYIEDENLS